MPMKSAKGELAYFANIVALASFPPMLGACFGSAVAFLLCFETYVGSEGCAVV